VIAIVATLVVLALVRTVTALRVSDEQEMSGLDLALHGETAYSMMASGGSQVSGHSEWPATAAASSLRRAAVRR